MRLVKLQVPLPAGGRQKRYSKGEFVSSKLPKHQRLQVSALPIPAIRRDGFEGDIAVAFALDGAVIPTGPDRAHDHTLPVLPLTAAAM